MKKQNEEFTLQDAFIREVDEDLKNESMKKLWDKYGLFIIIIVVASLTLAVSYESLKTWYIHRAENRADAYAAALSMQNQARFAESEEAFDLIISEKLGAYAGLAKMQKANLLLEQDKIKEALELLKEISEDKSVSPQLHDTALIKLASYRQDSASFEEMEELLRPIAENEENAWNTIARDILATVLLRDGKTEEAGEIYNSLLQNPDASEDLKNRIKDILSVL